MEYVINAGREFFLLTSNKMMLKSQHKCSMILFELSELSTYFLNKSLQVTV